MWETTNSYKVLMGKLPGKHSLGRQSENDIKMELWEIGCGRGRWKELVQDRDQLRPLILAVLKFVVLRAVIDL
jgi:hypothetical protein